MLVCSAWLAWSVPIGRLVELDERDDAAWMAARVSKTAAGDEVLELAKDAKRQLQLRLSKRRGRRG